MIKKTLYFGNPAYLSLQNKQLVIKLPEVDRNASLPECFKSQSVITRPIEDIGLVILDHKQITISCKFLCKVTKMRANHNMSRTMIPLTWL